MQDGELFGLLGRLVGLSSGDLRLDAVIRLTCGRTLKLKPLPCQADLFDGKSECESVVAAFAEQFATDVSGIGDGQRKMLLSAAGDRALRIVTATFIADFVPRVWAGFEALGMGRPGNGPEVAWDPDTDPAQVLLAEFVPAVARLRKLDPVTTEVVRLRGATQHNCRLCKSLREEKALDAGGSEELYGDIERYESSTRLTDRHKAALRYVDALLWTPSDIDTQVSRGVRKCFSEAEAAELTLDVMRNAANKIAVALGADAARVESGTETYLVDEDGQTVFA
jgi:alkylhydroperoxidase family enzyme